jgi:hypothetical protein
MTINKGGILLFASMNDLMNRKDLEECQKQKYHKIVDVFLLKDIIYKVRYYHQKLSFL